MKRARNLAQLALTTPANLVSLSLSEWDMLIRQGRSAGILGTIHRRLEQLGLLEHLPNAPRNHLNAACNLAGFHERVLRWEVHCVQ
jgi:hypothetical protein